MKFEYCVVSLLGWDLIKIDETLNGLGAKGWQLVSVSNDTAYFKRCTTDLAAQITGYMTTDAAMNLLRS